MTRQTTSQPSPRQQRQAEDFLHDRGLLGPTASMPPLPAAGSLGTGRDAAAPAAAAFAHRGMGAASVRPLVSAEAAHAEQPGHRHRGAERHSAH
ncbi:hypothetical protein [Streptacidiphilus cavernicola]|uniref:Uncharacterized protein n=1 Tax=Streptacidiphilus cavernicola TaxID=3342716 RepID=A0ABV6W423_9ACTN